MTLKQAGWYRAWAILQTIVHGIVDLHAHGVVWYGLGIWYGILSTAEPDFGLNNRAVNAHL